MGSLLIITSMEAICFFLGKELDMADSSMDTWKTEWIKHMNSRK